MIAIISTIITGIGSVAVVMALLYSARQTRTLTAQFELEREQDERSLTTQRAGNDLKLMENIVALDRLFVDNPELRPYFYDGLDVPDVDPARARVLATAELIIDLADSVTNMIRLDQLGIDDQAAWIVALKFYGRSPAVRSAAQLLLRPSKRPTGLVGFGV